MRGKYTKTFLIRKDVPYIYFRNDLLGGLRHTIFRGSVEREPKPPAGSLSLRLRLAITSLN